MKTLMEIIHAFLFTRRRKKELNGLTRDEHRSMTMLDELIKMNEKQK